MSRKTRLLIIEDEPAILTGLVDVFIFHGYDVDTADNGHDGLKKALSGRFDLILLDIMLPGMDGYEICQRIRQQDRQQKTDQPIIMLTAKSHDDDIIQGLSLGADDYVAKPFSVAQLVLRVKAVLRRSAIEETLHNRIQLSEHIDIDCLNLSAQCHGQTVSFTRREMEILQYLHANTTRPVSRDELLTKVWGYAKTMGIETRTVDIHVAKLRRKIEAVPAQPQHLITVRGAGYKLIKS